LSGPGGTNSGRMSPALRWVSRTGFCGYYVGRLDFSTTVVSPIGVFQSILPTLMG